MDIHKSIQIYKIRSIVSVPKRSPKGHEGWEIRGTYTRGIHVLSVWRGVNHAREWWNGAVISAKPPTIRRREKGDGKGTSGIIDVGRRERATSLLTEFRKD